MKRLLFIFLAFLLFSAYAQTEKHFDTSSIKVNDDICIKNLSKQPINVRVTADVDKVSDILVTNINMKANSQVNYLTAISNKLRKIDSINVFTDKKVEIKVYGYDGRLIIELSDDIVDSLINDVNKKNAFTLNEGNILDYWVENGSNKRKGFRDKLYITNYSTDDNVILTIYGYAPKGSEKKIGTIAINSKYETHQVYLYVDKIENFTDFVIVPSNDKSYTFYASTNHGDMFVFFENEGNIQSSSKVILGPSNAAGIPDKEGNYLINPEYNDEDLSDNYGWKFLTENNAKGSIQIKNNEAILQCIKGTNIPTDLQLCQLNIPLKGNKNYLLTFDAYAEQACPLRVTVCSPMKNWFGYLNKNFSVGLSKKTYNFRFNIGKMDDNVKFEFDFSGNSNAIIHISNVTIKEIE